MPTVEEFFGDFISVMSFLFNKIGRRFFFTFYRGEAYYLFLTALLPFVFMFCFDIVMSFIFSVRCRQVRFFNVLSPRSWRAFNSSSYNSLPPDRLKAATPANRFTSTFKGIYSPFIYRVNDSIRLRNGYTATYLGTKYVNGQRAYIYRIGGVLYTSSLRPRKFSKIQLNFITNNHNTNNNYYSDSSTDSSSSDNSSSGKSDKYMNARVVEANLRSRGLDPQKFWENMMRDDMRKERAAAQRADNAYYRKYVKHDITVDDD